MTVHAGQKAARLRRATSATSSTTPSPSLLSTAPQWTPISLPAPGSPSVLCSPPDGVGGIVVSQEVSGPASPSSLTPSSNLENLLLQKRLKPGRGKNRRKTPSRPSSSAHRFIFSGLEPEPGTESVIGDLDWQKVDADDSNSTDGILSSASSLVFVQQPSRSTSNSSMADKHPCAPSEVPPSETLDGRGVGKANPLNFLPWFLSIGGAADKNRNNADQGTVEGGINEKGVIDSHDDKNGSGNGKSKRKKKKGKAKAKTCQIPADDEDNKADAETVIKTTRSSQAVSSERLVSVADTDGCECRFCFKPCWERADGTPSNLVALLVIATDEPACSSRRSSLCDSFLRQAASSDTVTCPSDVTVPVRGSAAGDSLNIEIEEATEQPSGVLSLDTGAYSNDARHQKGSTETSYHTAAPATPIFDNGGGMIGNEVQTAVYSSLLAPAVATSEEVEAQTTIVTSVSSTSSMDPSPVPPPSEVKMREVAEGLFTADQDASVSTAGFLLKTEPNCAHENPFAAPEPSTDSFSGDTWSVSHPASAHDIEEEERATSSSRDNSLPRGMQQEKQCESRPPKSPRRDTAESPQGDRYQSKWVRLLPSFENIHPHRSLRREINLRMLSWLGLEEYVARRVRTFNDDGRPSESVVWITHSCSSRRTMAFRSRGPKAESYLYSSALWFQGGANANEEARDVRKESCDAVREYQMHILESKNGATAWTTQSPNVPSPTGMVPCWPSRRRW